MRGRVRDRGSSCTSTSGLRSPPSRGRELVEHVHAAGVHEDFMSVRSGVNGTSGFYIDGVRYHHDSYDLETILAALERVGV